jgi:hypothetical protein
MPTLSVRLRVISFPLIFDRKRPAFAIHMAYNVGDDRRPAVSEACEAAERRWASVSIDLLGRVLVIGGLASRLIPHRHRARAELQPTHKLQVNILR